MKLSKSKIFSLNYQKYFITFLIPVIIMIFYFIAIGAYPFGNNTIMTVDLGQQYIDFFGAFRDTILNHPTSFFYSFAKDLGGDTMGVWSYYLLSPLNFIFLFFTKSNLDIAVIIITLIKYGLNSLTFFIFARNTTKNSNPLLIATSVSYSLSGYFIANQFNLMWLDAGYFLPIIALGIFKLFKGSHFNLYPLSLAAILIINYYMGYMICIFAVLYFIYLAAVNYQTFRQTIKLTAKFIWASIIAAGLAAIILLPTFFQLTQSKGSYTIKSIHWKFEYDPLKMFTKFNVGAFNFDAISSGYPNLYLPSLILVITTLYFFIKQIPIRVRFTALLITFFLFLSMCFEPLDLLWHGFQFPVWYPYRFSYLAIFWLLILALTVFENIELIAIKKLIIPAIGAVFIIYLSIYFKNKISYLNYSLIMINALLFILSIAIFGGLINKYSLANKILPFFIIFEAITNAYVSLSTIGFISHSEFSEYVQNVSKVVQKVQKKDSDFFRIGKSFERTNNDAMLLDFNGTDQFNSMLEPKTSTLYAKLGQPQSEGDVIYGNGNLFTDSFLNLKYFLDLKITGNKAINYNIYKPIGSRSDIQNYGVKEQFKNIIVKENPYALKIAFLVSPKVLKSDLSLINPIMNYNVIYQSFNSQNDHQDLFYPFYVYTEKLINLKKKVNDSWTTYTKIRHSRPGKIIITLKPQTDDPYYVSLNGDLGDNKLKYTVDGKNINQDPTIQNTIVQSIFQNKKGKDVRYEISSDTNKFTLYDFGFYFMETSKFLIQNNQLQKNQLKITKQTSNEINGKIDVNKNNQVLFYSIPVAPGWQAYIDHHKVKIKKAFKNFIAISIPQGNHQVKIVYFPPFLKLGILITCLTLIIYLLYLFFSHSSKFN